MTLIKSLFICYLFIVSNSYGQQKSEAFLVTIKNLSIHVVSPTQQEETVSVVVKNETSENILSQLKTEDRVLKRFNLKPQSQRAISLSTKDIEKLYYISIAPPFQSVELKYNQRPYEIPEKN